MTIQHSNKINRSGRFIMDLSQLLRQKLNRSTRSSLLLSSLILLSGCTTLPADTVIPKQQDVANQTEVVPEKVETAAETIPLTAELTYLILTAEVASQRGDPIGAAELYNRAASMIESPKLASRSTQMANFTRDQRRI